MSKMENTERNEWANPSEVYSDAPETSWQGYTRNYYAPAWSEFTEKEKWKTTVGVMLRGSAIMLGLWLLLMLVVLLAT